MDLELKTAIELRAEEAQKCAAFASLSLRHVRGQIAEALSHFGRLGVLEEYTKHDISHIDGMLEMYEWMIPEPTKTRMTPADWLLLTLSTYMHDFGLLVTRAEFEARESLQAFVTFSRRVLNPQDLEFADYRAQLESMGSARADEFLYQEFVRAHHADRIQAWLLDTPDLSNGGDLTLAKELQSIFGDVDETFREDVGLICKSHHSDDLGDLKKYPTSKPYGPSASEEANLQYSAFLLRTADLLHITRDRVPSMAALVINPRNPVSQTEWAKQASVRSVRPKAPELDPTSGQTKERDAIEVHATFKDAEGFFGLTQFLKYAGRELAQTHSWSAESERLHNDGYSFPWRRIDVSHIEAKGFVAEPFEFSIDQSKILDLLTGHTLYNDSDVVVRELVQNSLDAVRLQAAIVKADPAASEFVPRIEVAWDSSTRTLEIKDNGVGMSQAVIEKNFLRVGSSHYQDADFRKSYPDFASISRFGIGVLSAFMVADDVSVVTTSIEETQARQLSLRDVHGQYLVRLLEKTSVDVPEMLQEHGTLVRLKLRPSADLTDIETILRHWVIMPDCDVLLSVDSGSQSKIGFRSLKDALREGLLTAELVRETGASISTLFGDEVEIREQDIDGCNVVFAVSWSRWLQEWQFIRIEADRFEQERPQPKFGTSIGGIRVTESSPGFVTGGIAAMANVRGKKAPRTNVARSAIERTEEYDAFLGGVYSAYTRHVSAEMSEFEGSRSGSATRAAIEGSYMLNDISLRVEIDSEQILRREVQAIPLLVIENGQSRARKSIKDIREYEELWSVEGTAVSSLESVLNSARGSTSVSLRRLVAALGDGAGLDLPDGPIICGRLSESLYSNRLFVAEWEPVAFETDGESRILRTTWQKNSSKPRWLGTVPPKNLPGSLRAQLGGRPFNRTGNSVMFPTLPEIGSKGIVDQLVMSQGRLYVLPENALVNIPKARATVSEADRRWAIAWMIKNLILGQDERLPFGSQTWNSSRPRDASWRSTVLDSMRDLRMFDLIDEESTSSALVAPGVNVLDVERWDKRASAN